MHLDGMLRAEVKAAHAQTTVPPKADALPDDDVAVRAVFGASAAAVAVFIRVEHFADEHCAKPLRPTNERHDFCAQSDGLPKRSQARNLLRNLRDARIDRRKHLSNLLFVILDREVGGHGEKLVVEHAIVLALQNPNQQAGGGVVDWMVFSGGADEKNVGRGSHRQRLCEADHNFRCVEGVHRIRDAHRIVCAKRDALNRSCFDGVKIDRE